MSKGPSLTLIRVSREEYNIGVTVTVTDVIGGEPTVGNSMSRSAVLKLMLLNDTLGGEDRGAVETREREREREREITSEAPIWNYVDNPIIDCCIEIICQYRYQ